ncbi:hypothetical protein DYQ86_08475 [Acidobacteria bacterium AB60]|nr:hypothetical protein DYQ86_08475 [Acidobacteria bacterium AB60]
MTIDTILSQIDSEIARLTQVRKLLAGSGATALTSTQRKSTSAGKKSSRKARVLSPEARKRIADAQRRRWAAAKSRSK